MGKKVGKDMGKPLSALELYIFMPCLTMESFVKNCTLGVFVDKLPLIGLSTAVLLVFCVPISRLVAKHLAKTPEEKMIDQYSLCFANSGYMGYPIIGAVFGEIILMKAMIYCIPFSIATYTYGMYLLVPQKGIPLKKLLNPVTIATASGIILGLSGIPIPEVAGTVLEMGADCMAPAAMLLTGLVLAEKPLPFQFKNIRAYIASVWRLILIPVLVAVVLYVLKIRGEMLLIPVALLAMPMGLNSIIVPEAYGSDVSYASQATFISTLLGIITIPIILSVINMLAF